MVAFEIPAEFGYVIAVVILSGFVNIWLGVRVGLARRKYGVKYPTMYATAADVKDPKDALVFNCIQRGHQNHLESYTFFLALLLIGGVHKPVIAAIGGVVYLLGRIVYAIGYGTGDPAKRNRGGFSYFGLLAVLYTAGSFAYSLISAI